MNGVLPSQVLHRMAREGVIAADRPLVDDQVQPASIDLRLGARAWRVRASFLAGRDSTVTQRLHDLGMHEIDLAGGALLEKGCVYVVPLRERLALPPGVRAVANAKSSTGRLDLLDPGGDRDRDRVRPDPRRL